MKKFRRNHQLDAGDVAVFLVIIAFGLCTGFGVAHQESEPMYILWGALFVWGLVTAFFAFAIGITWLAGFITELWNGD